MITRTQRLTALQHQIARLERQIALLRERSNRYATLRFLTFAGGWLAVAAAYLSIGRTPALLLVLLTILTFAALVRVHRRIQTSLKKHLLWQHIKRTHLARMNVDWGSLPPAVFQPDEPHFIEVDLDLGLLHQLLDTTTSQGGSQRLRQFLLPTSPDQQAISERQQLVRELIARPLFRDKLTLLGQLANDDVQEQAEGQKLQHWLAQSTPAKLQATLRWLLPLALLNILLFGLFQLGVLPPLWVGTWLLYMLLFLNQGKVTSKLLSEALLISYALRKLTAVLGYMEQYPYPPMLRRHCAPLLEARPSQQLRRLEWLIAGASVQRNPYLWFPLNAIIPWDVLMAVRLQYHREKLAAHLPGWLDLWFDLEALSALATFAALNPEYTFPHLSQQPVYQAQQLGHPLIPYTRKVHNDFALHHTGEVVIITGSNMAGKSSFLRTLGVNLCLAYAGAPVNAVRLELGLLRMFTCIRVTDSLNDGISYFYAEVRRLKALLDALQQPHPQPLFFLIDEIFRGTNNRERLAGSRAYIQALIGGHGLGLIATHDLELVTLAEQYPTVQNYHFREEVVDGTMQFDYRLRPGPSPTTNALKIMRLAGLPVEEIR